jgi:RNA polymerase-interacting CarD/CdnL/TRCF family regulator
MFAYFLPSFSRDGAMRMIPLKNARQVAIRALVEEDGDSEVMLVLVTAAFYWAVVASMLWWLFA